MAQDAENPVQVHLVLTETAWNSRRCLAEGSWLPTALHFPECLLTTITRMRALTTSVQGLRTAGSQGMRNGEAAGCSKSHQPHWDTHASSQVIFLRVNHCKHPDVSTVMLIFPLLCLLLPQELVQVTPMGQGEWCWGWRGMRGLPAVAVLGGKG